MDGQPYAAPRTLTLGDIASRLARPRGRFSVPGDLCVVSADGRGTLKGMLI
jgi:hypothetical protein